MAALESDVNERSGRPHARLDPRGLLDRAPRWVGRPTTAVSALWLVFTAGAVWWAWRDGRLADWDTARHESIALAYADAFHLHQGVLLAWWHSGVSPPYPPLVHLVGLATIKLLGLAHHTLVLVADLVFSALLAAGCYGAGRRCYGPRAGVWAAGVALSAPIVVSLARGFMLDVPEAALVAASLWALLACERFAHAPRAALAGLVVGIGLLSKNTFVLFVIGPIAVMVLRGGWRHWRGIAVFAITALATGGPWWYIAHSAALFAYSNQQVPAYGLLSGLRWYLGFALAADFYLPLSACIAGGAAWALIRLARLRCRLGAQDYAPELLAGLLVGVGAQCFVRGGPDGRYILPALPYAAILTVAWFAHTHARRLTARVGNTVVGGVCALNFLTAASGHGPSWSVTLPGVLAQVVHIPAAVVVSTQGYAALGGAQPGVRLRERFASARRAGVKRVVLPNDPNLEFLNITGLALAAREEKLNSIWIGAARPQSGDLDLAIGPAPPPGWVACSPAGAGAYLLTTRLLSDGRLHPYCPPA